MFENLALLENITAELQAGNFMAAKVVAENALATARAECEAWADWAERENAAQEAWLQHGAQLIADLEGVPF